MKIALEEDLASRSSSLQSDSYLDAGTRLTFTIVKALGLPGWNDGLPTYTPDEIQAITQELSTFQRMADAEQETDERYSPSR
jgi:hypothetical protein